MVVNDLGKTMFFCVSEFGLCVNVVFGWLNARVLCSCRHLLAKNFSANFWFLYRLLVKESWSNVLRRPVRSLRRVYCGLRRNR